MEGTSACLDEVVCEGVLFFGRAMFWGKVQCSEVFLRENFFLKSLYVAGFNSVLMRRLWILAN